MKEETKPGMTAEDLFALMQRQGMAPGPVDYSQVPKETREWMQSLRTEDLAEITEAIKFMRSARTVGRFGRWVLITFVAIFSGAVLLGERFATVLKWLGGGR